MSDKVFVVTHGEYSDYCIVGVFSTKDKAAEACPAAAAEIGSARIEEWGLDTADEALLQQVFQAKITIDTGAIISETPYERAECRQRDWSTSFVHPEYNSITAYSVVSQEHALKVAIEARQAALRTTHT